MKITKSQLKQIIMEELNETHYALGPLSVDVPDQYVMEKLAQVVDPIADVYNDLATPEEQETFEENLVKEIDEYVQQWRQQRGEEM
jgi:cob(I)alamin adenosyltransferase